MATPMALCPCYVSSTTLQGEPSVHLHLLPLSSLFWLLSAVLATFSQIHSSNSIVGAAAAMTLCQASV